MDTLLELNVTGQIGEQDDSNLSVIMPSRLRKVDLRGVEWLTRSDLRRLSRCWEEVRREVMEDAGIKIVEEEEVEDVNVEGDEEVLREECSQARAEDGPTHNLGYAYATPQPRKINLEREPSFSTSATSYSSAYHKDQLLTPPVSPVPMKAIPRPIAFPSPSSSSSSSSPYSTWFRSSFPSTPPPESIISALLPVASNKRDAFGKMKRGMEIAGLSKGWAEKIGIEILSTAVLESDDEDGYRRFIREVSGFEIED